MIVEILFISYVANGIHKKIPQCERVYLHEFKYEYSLIS